jgi:hypothetical protein
MDSDEPGEALVCQRCGSEDEVGIDTRCRMCGNVCLCRGCYEDHNPNRV